MESVVHAVGVVPNKPINQLAIEKLRRLELGNVIINKLLLNGAVEPLAVGVHLWSLGICVIVKHMQPPQFFVKMLHKLRTVVRQNKSNGEWENLEAKQKKFSGRG